MTAGSVGRWRWRGTPVVAAVLLTIAGCTASTASTSAAPSSPTTRTVVRTSIPAVASFTPAAPAAVHPLPPGAHPRAAERDGTCPYIRAGLDESSDRNPNIANLEGDRVYRTTRLIDLHPVGCRFYFYSGPFEAVADIRPRTFRSPGEAHNAMVLTARTGTQLIPERDFVPGVDGICFRTRFFGPDGRRDWAFVFAKGRVMVAVYTQRKDTSRNALYIARAIAKKF